MADEVPVTVALPTFNRCGPGYLRESLNAILSQTYRDFELLVIDNHSSDATPQFIAECHDPRLTYVRQPPGGNPTTSYIRALTMARGKYIIVTHDDDIMAPTLIEHQVDFMERNPDMQVVASNVSLIDEAGSLIQAALYDLAADRVFGRCEYIATYFEEKLWLPAPTFLLRRESFLDIVLRDLGRDAHSYLASGDLWQLFTLNLRGSIGLLADSLLKYRQHRGQESRNVDQGFPVIEAIRLFLAQSGDDAHLRPHLPAIHAFLTRFRAQEICFGASTREEVTRRLSELQDDWTSKGFTYSGSTDALVPFEIALHLLGLAGSTAGVRTAPAGGTGSRGQRAFRHWREGLRLGMNLFDRVPWKRIAIHGSMLNAYLIRESAEQAGIQVVGCFDSSPARIGKYVADVPVRAIEELPICADRIDAVVLSSEHDHEDAIVNTVRSRHLLGDRDVPLVSWKDLAEQMLPGDVQPAVPSDSKGNRWN